MNSQHHTMILGAAGELRVMSELMLRGFNPAKTYLDNGIDIILENGKSIQVKASQGSLHKYNHKPTWRSNLKCYNFTCQDWKNKKSIKADFVICWAIGAETFLIIPKEKINVTVQWAPEWESRTKFYPYINNWDILK